MYKTPRDLYNDKKWKKFRLVIINERRQQNGTVLCEECGKTIINVGDLHLHHIEELTEKNINDINITFNPNNISLLHAACHNAQKHKNRGYFIKREKRRIYVLNSPPYGNKRETLAEYSDPSKDIVVDITRIYQALTIDGKDYAGFCAPLARVMYEAVIQQVSMYAGNWQCCFVLTSDPHRASRERLAAKLGAETIEIETPKKVCLERAARNKMAIESIERYFENYN